MTKTDPSRQGAPAGSRDLTAVFRDCASRGRNAAWRYLAAIGLGLAFAVGIGLLIGLGFQLNHLLPADLAEQVRHPTRPATFFALTGTTFAALLVGVAAAIRVVQGKRLGDIIGLWSWRGFGAGLGLWTVALCGLSVVDLALAPAGFSISATARTPQLALWALIGLAPQVFAEEFIFRGYLTQGLLLATRRPPLAALISGLVFGAMHIPNGWPQALGATLFGILLAWLAIRTGGIAFTTGLHLINNWFGAVIVVSAGDVFRGVPGLLTQTTPQLMWWDTALSSGALLALVLLLYRRGAKGERGEGEGEGVPTGARPPGETR